MAKSPDSEKKSVQVHMVMSPTEVAAIDDWSFRNKVRGRTEAVRRLASIGLALEAQEERLEGLVKTVAVDQIDKLREAISAIPEDADPEAEIEALLNVAGEALVLANDASRLSAAVATLLVARDQYAWHWDEENSKPGSMVKAANLQELESRLEQRKDGIRERLGLEKK